MSTTPEREGKFKDHFKIYFGGDQIPVAYVKFVAHSPVLSAKYISAEIKIVWPDFWEKMKTHHTGDLQPGVIDEAKWAFLEDERRKTHSHHGENKSPRKSLEKQGFNMKTHVKITEKEVSP